MSEQWAPEQSRMDCKSWDRPLLLVVELIVGHSMQVQQQGLLV